MRRENAVLLKFQLNKCGRGGEERYFEEI